MAKTASEWLLEQAVPEQAEREEKDRQAAAQALQQLFAANAARQQQLHAQQIYGQPGQYAAYEPYTGWQQTLSGGQSPYSSGGQSPYSGTSGTVGTWPGVPGTAPPVYPLAQWEKDCQRETVNILGLMMQSSESRKEDKAKMAQDARECAEAVLALFGKNKPAA